MKRFKTGVNFGCWISQYKELDYDLFRKMSTREDVFRVRDWGFDHIRLPFDYPLLLDEGDLYTFKPQGIALLDDMIDWCQEAGIAILLDLHWAPGYRFQDIGNNALFSDPELMRVFTSLWVQLAKRYQGVGDMLAFDLLNEVAEEAFLDPWIALAQDTVRAIREVSAERDIIYGGANYNSVHMLEKVPVMQDDHLTYNFHYYEPILFTHQFASWNRVNMAYASVQEYPADFPRDLRQFTAEYPQFDGLSRYFDLRCDRATLEQDLAKAGEFQQKTGRRTYCGEYGVYDKAPQDSKLNWMRDVTELFNHYQIGRAVWNYLGGGFGLYDWQQRKEVEPDVVRIITKTW